MTTHERRGGAVVVGHVIEFRGVRDPAVHTRVSVHLSNGDPVEVLLPHVVHHSSTGFEWGYHGSGPADLALSILAYTLGETTTVSTWIRAGAPVREAPFESWQLHQAFKREVVAGLEHDRWTLPILEVVAWLVLHGVAVRIDAL
jgi:hypothetical protein